MNTLKNILLRITHDIRRCRVGLVLLLIYFAVTQAVFHTVCPFAILLGLPCPGCGLTRAGILLLTGDLIGAAHYNLTIFLWVALILYGIIFRYILGKRPPLYLFCAAAVGILSLLWYVYGLLLHNTVPVPCEGLLRPYIEIISSFLRKFIAN